MLSFGLLLAVLCGVFVSLLPLVSWLQGDGAPRQMWMIVLGHALAIPVLIVIAVLTGQGGAGLWFLVVAVATGLCFAINGGLYYAAAMRLGPMAVSWVVVWLSAVGVAVVGWFVLGEPIYAGQPVAVLCLVGCLAAMGRATWKASREAGGDTAVKPGFWLSLTCSLIAAVVGVTLIKCRPAGGTVLMFITGETAGVMLGSLVMAAWAKLRPVADRRTWGCSLLWALFVVPQYLLAASGLVLVDASVFQPTMAGAGLTLGVIWSALRGDRPRPMVWLGASLALLSIGLINWPRIVLIRW
jgi:drug/metabolite transporter (DMT)-like permease